MKTRIVKDVADFREFWYFPEYYVSYLFGLISFWKRFREWRGCDPIGMDYGYGDVYFKKEDDAKEFLIKKAHKPKVVWEKL